MRTERSKRSVLQYVSIASTARMRNAERSSPCGNSRETNVLLALHDLPHQKRLGAGLLEARHRRIGLQARHDQHEPDAAVEHAPHLVLLDATLFLPPIEDRRPLPALRIADGLAALGARALPIAGDAAAGAMRTAT